LLADLGADVVKVERLDGGDGMREWPPAIRNGIDKSSGYSGNVAALNRNKRSITLNVCDPVGRNL
jgi:crotonobetainyl-CoA:carnitine CoA-transferase CaiB-like acyl-CoA transferase